MIIPTEEELKRHARVVPEIDPSSVLTMLHIIDAYGKIRHQIMDVVERDYNLSEGKLIVMASLYQEQKPLALSVIAQRVGVTKATITTMIQRMVRDGLVTIMASPDDGRSKLAALTETGMTLMNQVLLDHYGRISKLMERLSTDEQQQLRSLLEKIADA